MTVEKRGWKFVAIPTDVVLSEALTDFDVRVYGYLLWRAGEKSRAWPGLPKMAKDLKRGVTMIKESLKRLQDEHWIKRVRRFGGSAVTYVFERQKDCLEFIAERDAAKSSAALQVVRLAADAADRTDVRIAADAADRAQLAAHAAHDQPPTRPTNSRPRGQQNYHPMNDQPSNVDRWMDGDTDVISTFLKALPGYNPKNLANDRAAITHPYDATALTCLWTDCAGADNQIGLFLYRAAQGIQSARYLDQIAEEQRRAAAQQLPVVSPVRRDTPPAIVPDASVTQPLSGTSTHMTPSQVWQAAQGELQLQVNRATFDTWIKPAEVISVNGVWKIAVPHKSEKDWWETKMLSTVKRIMHGIVGQPCELEFIAVSEATHD